MSNNEKWSSKGAIPLRLLSALKYPFDINHTNCSNIPKSQAELPNKKCFKEEKYKYFNVETDNEVKKEWLLNFNENNEGLKNI